MSDNKLGRHLSNTYDPKRQYAKSCFSYSYHAMISGQSMMDYEWKNHLDWINQNVTGEPKGTDNYSVQQLKDIGMIGVYAKQ